MKIRPFGAELFHADGRTDRHDEVNSLFFSRFCERVYKLGYLIVLGGAMIINGE